MEALPYSITLLLPSVIDIIGKDVKDPNKRVILSYVVCLVAGFVISYPHLVALLSNYDLYHNIIILVSNLGIVYAATNGLYQLFYKESALRQKVCDLVAKKPEVPQVAPAPTTPEGDIISSETSAPITPQ